MNISAPMPRTLRWLALALVLSLALAACATVPHTGRRQLSMLPEGDLLKMSLTQYSEVLAKSKLSTDKRQVAMVRRVGYRIAAAAEDFLRQTGQGDQIRYYQWEFNLIDDDSMVNAWAMPGGKTAVYTGLLPVARDETGLAVVMGHEVAHALAHHGNERMSQQLLVAMGGVALAVALQSQPSETRNLFLLAYGAGTTVGFALPYSRLHESEADRIGLVLMAKAGYDPRAAPGFWKRMMAEGGGSRPPEFLSTHPDPATRVENLKHLIPEAMEYYTPRG